MSALRCSFKLRSSTKIIEYNIQVPDLGICRSNMLFLRIITSNQISNLHVSLNKEIIFERYRKTSLSNECAEVISTNLEEVKIGLF